MDRRSWPWKKKSSEKTLTSTDTASSGNQADQLDDTKSVKYVQISAETYARLTELEDEVKVLNEKLSSAQAEMTSKDNLVKQHAKVAEEAVSGWEKAEAEALALKHQLESVTLLKLTAEEKASHLDGALKECMKQIRNVKEESEQKLHDVVFAKTKQWEKVKLEFETKIVDFEQELLRASAENAALSRSLQERTNVLMKISEEKSESEAEIEVLKANIQLCEKEMNSLKYELHIVSKELEIRNEEKNMSMRSAEVANKQHVEDVKKITKLEAECQRLRGMVRKKLPGPAALAQMKLEVENLGQEYGETKLRRSPAKNSSPHLIPAPDFAVENSQQFQKENEFLTARLLAMEEETKMLKEALSKRNGELQASRNICAKTANKLRILEAHILVLNQQKSHSRSNIDISFHGSLSHNGSNPPSLTSMSEDGIDEDGSCAESWATALISELSQFKKDKDIETGNKVANSKHLELMDDFLEMERLACLSTEINGVVSPSNHMMDEMRNENGNPTLLVEVQKDGTKEECKVLEQPVLASSVGVHDDRVTASEMTRVHLSKLQSRIASVFQSQAQNTDMWKFLEDIKHILQDTQVEFPQNSANFVNMKSHFMDATSEHKNLTEEIWESTASESVKQDSNSSAEDKNTADEDLKTAISQIYDFVISLGRKAVEIQGSSFDDQDLNKKVEDFSASVNRVLCGEIGVNNFIMSLSYILSITSELSCSILHDKINEGESNSSDCVDKVTLLENKVAQHKPLKEGFSGVCMLVSHSASDPEFEGPIGPGFEVMMPLPKFSLEQFEQLKLEKENIETNLAKCTETLEHTKLKLVETEQQLEELKLQLAASQKSNSLAETQLKCMAESYESLESHTQELENEICMLRTKAETLDNELQEERRSHQDDLVKYNDLQAKIEREEKCSACSIPTEAEVGIKMKQEREIAAAAEKLAECQETIFLLGRQLQAMRPPAEQLDSSLNNGNRSGDDFLDDASQSGMLASQELDQAEMENTASASPRTGGEYPLDGYNFYMSPSDTESSNFKGSPISSKRQKHRSSRSSSSSSLSSTLPEKHGRGFSRFFTKGKSDH